jgi:hypothetical protein
MRTVRLLIGISLAAGLLAMAAPARAGSFNATEEAHVRNHINKTRAAKGLPALASNADLVKMARGQSTRMDAKGGIFHNPSLGPEALTLGLDWRKLGENVGMGPDIGIIQEAFVNSPHHYENIVDPAFNAVGVGVVVTGTGTRFITHVFAKLNGAVASVPEPTLKPVVPTPKPAPVVAPMPTIKPQPVPVRPAAPKPTVRPASPKPVVRGPNAVVGGVIRPVRLDLELGERSEGLTKAFDKVLDVLAFWA